MASRSRDTSADAREFFRRLQKEGAWAPVFLVQGEERYLVNEAVRRLGEAVFPGGRDDLNYDSFQGTEASGQDIVSAASQVPMFAARRLVIARGIERLKAADLEAIAGYAESPFDTCVLVLEAVKLDGRTSAAKRLTKASGVAKVVLDGIRDREAPDWVIRQARRRGLNMPSAVANYLVQALGTSLGALDMAVERLDLYLGAERDVTLEAAQALVPDTRARSVFELLDHLADGAFGEAVACFHRMVDQGESPIGVLAMIARLFRQLAQIRDADAAGLADREVAARAGCPPFFLGDLRRSARRFGDRRLRDLMGAIAETDLALKSSRVRSELIVERLFLRICATT